ncbi:fungal tRNA ligase phosphodiesterase domain-containing protein [Gautieria morchelliformis]|nr:fungal tRNA ligase phosphodiesterase domain-containing protein [Gautieria morchelliformis]
MPQNFIPLEKLADNEVDEISEMDITEDLEGGLSPDVNGLTYTPQSQKQDVVRQPVQTSKTAEKETSNKQRAPAKPPRYFGLLPKIDLDAIVGGRLAEADAPAQAKAFWDELRKNGRVTHRPHITLVHSRGLPQEQPLWDRCSALHLAATPPPIIFRLGNIVCNERIMAVTVDDLRISPEGEGADMEAGVEFLEKLPQEVRNRLHITVGTRDKSIVPVEAKALVKSWRNGAKATSIALKDIESRGRVKGLMS